MLESCRVLLWHVVHATWKNDPQVIIRYQTHTRIAEGFGSELSLSTIIVYALTVCAAMNVARCICVRCLEGMVIFIHGIQSSA